MSTYYSFYLFYKPDPKKDELKYCGPYDQKGKVASIYSYSRGFDNGFIEKVRDWDINEDQFEKFGLDPYFEKWEDDFCGGRNLYTILFSDIVKFSDLPLKKAYFRSDIFRDKEIAGETIDAYDLSEFYEYNMYEYDDEKELVPILSEREYLKAPPEIQQKYTLEVWNDMNSPAVHGHTLFTIANNWFEENIEYNSEFKDFSRDNVVFVVSIG